MMEISVATQRRCADPHVCDTVDMTGTVADSE